MMLQYNEAIEIERAYEWLRDYYKKPIHPEYRQVVFQDTSSGEMFLTRSTIETSETIDYDGDTLPLACLREGQLWLGVLGED